MIFSKINWLTLKKSHWQGNKSFSWNFPSPESLYLALSIYNEIKNECGSLKMMKIILKEWHEEVAHSTFRNKKSRKKKIEKKTNQYDFQYETYLLKSSQYSIVILNLIYFPSYWMPYIIMECKSIFKYRLEM